MAGGFFYFRTISKTFKTTSEQKKEPIGSANLEEANIYYCIENYDAWTILFLVLNCQIPALKKILLK